MPQPFSQADLTVATEKDLVWYELQPGDVVPFHLHFFGAIEGAADAAPLKAKRQVDLVMREGQPVMLSFDGKTYGCGQLLQRQALRRCIVRLRQQQAQQPRVMVIVLVLVPRAEVCRRGAHQVGGECPVAGGHGVVQRFEDAADEVGNRCTDRCLRPA